MKTNQTRSVEGFTLVEIMIVWLSSACWRRLPFPICLKRARDLKPTTCINNLRQIDTAVQHFAVEARKHVGDTITYPDDLTPYIKLNTQGKIPPCPSGGNYTLTTLGTVRRPSVRWAPRSIRRMCKP